MWNVLVVEDDPLMQEFFCNSVSANGQLKLVGRCSDEQSAKRWLLEGAADLHVLLTDLGLPDGSGLDIIRYARSLNPDCEPLVISMFGDEDNILASIEAGALGYIHKDSTPDDIAETILEMRDGGSPISPLIARRVLAKYQPKGPAVTTVADKPSLALNEPPNVPHDGPKTAQDQDLLSPKEFQVLDLIAQGYTYTEIAKQHGLSAHTIQTHIKRLYRKLNVHTRGEAVFEATRLGLL
jgi:DNA-binding NarL/FixJ family response regulator